LPIGDDPFSSLETAFDHRDISGSTGHLDRTGCHGLRRINHEDGCALLPGQHRHGRDREGVLLYIELHTHTHELAGPEGTVSIVETALEQDGTGAAIHCIVHENQPAFDGYTGAGRLCHDFDVLHRTAADLSHC
jgi:hypothetical protein